MILCINSNQLMMVVMSLMMNEINIINHVIFWSLISMVGIIMFIIVKSPQSNFDSYRVKSMFNHKRNEQK